jgi:hypothetical protein
MRDLLVFIYSEGSKLGKRQLSSLGERNTASDQEWEEEHELVAEELEPISDDEWSSTEADDDERCEDGTHSQTETDGSEEDSLLSLCFTQFINMVQRRLSGRMTVFWRGA